MTLEEKVNILYAYCEISKCDDCLLNDEKHNWQVPICRELADAHCLNIECSPEEDIEKALSILVPREEVVAKVLELQKQAPFICCPMCDEDKCVGRDNCLEIRNFIAARLKESKAEKSLTERSKRE